ncbi:MAG: argininosuccinate lyase [Bacteroidetes bacterium]|nr:MAG: argininosuccinate lyase [Bacteroidota bacterium]
MKNSKKLWDKNAPNDAMTEAFTIGQDRELDLRLAPWDVLGSLAHIKMLTAVGLLSATELEQLERALRDIYAQTQTGDFEIEPGVEDVHSQVELMLTRQLGDVGKKIHSGRSRNDQVLVDLRLFFRAEIREIVTDTKALFDTLQQLSEQHADVLMPGYTHLQVAMVSSFGLWFGAYAESLADDLRLWQSVFHIINQNPLGSAAGYGNSFPLNRQMTTRLLGFEDLCYNVIHAQSGRGKTELYLSFAVAALAHTLGKLAMDVCLFCNQNYGFLQFPDELTTGSSIMPHKKNPDVFELLRAKSGQLQSLPNQIMLLTGNLPSGYHRDFQLLKEMVFPALDTLKSCLRMTRHALSKAKVNPQILKDDKYKYLFSVEVVNELVLKGMPFRDAYKAVARQIADGSFSPPKTVRHTHEGSIGNLCTEQIRQKMAQTLDGFNFEKIENDLAQLLNGHNPT